ncbi:Surfeit locus protein 6 [Amphibalanus amphitrite]|uniref:Surfeit locus protein 6 n=1 Tax=Amphibalanus amphitrite TaxID=1232801 RepID=A0A6A4WRD8_AMPAM|nr:Surfeit locus protein 6 [Amphibalanus amphitrite]KAF0307879.1 Surfeit locus protein 6 [Amphibalanus amphitrite]
MKKKAKATEESISRSEEMELVQDDHDFICRVLSYLPAELKQGYGGDDSEESEAENDLPNTREERQAVLREKLHAKLQTLRAESPEKPKAKKASLKAELHKAREKQQKKQKGSGEAEKEAWETAMKKATGEKIRDDPKLIKKTMRRQQQKKKQSKKKWDERVQNEKKKKEERQNKRLGNIQERRDQKKKKIVNKLKKKGRILPGF